MILIINSLLKKVLNIEIQRDTVTVDSVLQVCGDSMSVIESSFIEIYRNVPGRAQRNQVKFKKIVLSHLNNQESKQAMERKIESLTNKMNRILASRSTPTPPKPSAIKENQFSAPEETTLETTKIMMGEPGELRQVQDEELSLGIKLDEDLEDINEEMTISSRKAFQDKLKGLYSTLKG